MISEKQQAKERAARIEQLHRNAVRDAAVMEQLSERLAEQAERLRGNVMAKDLDTIVQLYMSGQQIFRAPSVGVMLERIAELEAALRPIAALVDLANIVGDDGDGVPVFPRHIREAARVLGKGA